MHKPGLEEGFDAYLRSALTGAGITQAEIHRRTGIDESLLSKWSRGLTAAPDLPSLRKLASGLGLPCSNSQLPTLHQPGALASTAQ